MQLYSVSDAAEKCGISASTLGKYIGEQLKVPIAERKFNPQLVGKSYIFDQAQLDRAVAFCKARTSIPARKIDAEVLARLNDRLASGTVKFDLIPGSAEYGLVQRAVASLHQRTVSQRAAAAEKKVDVDG